MPNPCVTRRGVRRALLSGAKVLFVFKDVFIPDYAAGAIDGTLSSDGKACRRVSTGKRTSIGLNLIAARSGIE
jgi:hypothetical protein